MPESVDVPRPEPDGDRFAILDRMRALRNDARVAAIVLACIAVAAGVAWFRSGIAPAAPATGPRPATTTSGSSRSSTSSGSSRGSGPLPSTTSTTIGQIVVDVVGAVRAPGVVSLPATARVLDAIRAAGGAAPGADLSRLNLAARVGDGARVAVPVIGEPPPPVDPSAVTGSADPSNGGAPGGGATGTASPADPVDVNTATAAELEALPGIGPSLAAAIVQERDRNGPYRSVDDLDRVPGIGPGRLARLRDLVTV